MLIAVILTSAIQTEPAQKIFAPMHTIVVGLGIRLQLSLDSMDEETAMKVLHVKPDYIEQMKASIQKIEETGIRYQIATVLTSINDSLNNLDEIYGYLS